MISYSHLFAALHPYQSARFKGQNVAPAVKAAARYSCFDPFFMFSTQYPDPQTVVITRVMSKRDATRDKRVQKGMVITWPFVYMLTGASVTYPADRVDRALARLHPLASQHPDMFFSRRFTPDGSVVITKETCAEDVVKERKPGRRDWGFNKLGVGESMEFDVTFYTTPERLKVGYAASSHGQSSGKRFGTSSRTTAEGSRIITVVRKE